jgi:hypothetical protein
MLVIRSGILSITASFALLMVGLAWPPALGADYTDSHFSLIYLNLALNLVAAGTALLVHVRGGPWAVAAGILVALDWLYMAVVSAAV